LIVVHKKTPFSSGFNISSEVAAIPPTGYTSRLNRGRAVLDVPAEISISLADWTGIVETELFAQNYKNYGLATVSLSGAQNEAASSRLNGRGYTLRALAASAPRRH